MRVYKREQLLGKIGETDLGDSDGFAIGQTKAPQNAFIRPEINADFVLESIFNAGRFHPLFESGHVDICKIHSNGSDVFNPCSAVSPTHQVS
jgi:hypothetical protein